MPSRMKLSATFAATGLIVAACESQREGPFDRWIEDEDPDVEAIIRDVESPAPIRGEVVMTSPEAIDELADGATVDDLVELALARNPSIVAAREQVARLAQRIPQVESLPDPMLQASFIGEMAETAAGAVDSMATLSQKFPFPGKLDTVGRVATEEVAMAGRDLERTRLNVIADTRRAYWNLYFTARAIEVTEENRGLLQQFIEVSEAKYRAGTAMQQDVLRASTELSNLRADLVGLRQRRESAVAMLNRLIDRSAAAPIADPPSVELEQIELDLTSLLDEAAESNPDLAKMRDRIRLFRERLRLARLQRWPDLTVGLTYNMVDDEGLSMAATGDDQWWLGFGVNLPIWLQRYEAAEKEAARGILESVAQLGDVQNRVAFRVEDALLRVQAQQELVKLFRDEIVPQARQTVDASLSGYRGAAGRVDFLTVIENWRRLLNFQLMYHRNLSQLEQDFATLQEAVGEDLEREPRDPASRLDEPEREPDMQKDESDGTREDIDDG